MELTELNYFTYINFYLALFSTVGIFYFATGKNNFVLGIIIIWTILHIILEFNGFYNNTNTVPPRFLFLVFPGF